jgi:predicted nucleotidyltransferase
MLGRLLLDVARFGHDEVREQLLEDQTLAARAARSRVLVGSVPRSFPDRFRHGDPAAPRLGDLHPDVRRPSRRALALVARRYGLSEIRVFGSAVHADFRPDSDVDVMVKRKPGVRRSLADELAMRRDLESLVGREVDVSDASVLRDPIRAKAEAEGVVVYG